MNQKEFEERFVKNSKITGHGIEGTTMHMPCPFCGAADWCAYKVVEVRTALADPITCSECKRSAKAVVATTERGTGFQLVQTGGDDPPPYVSIRRETKLMVKNAIEERIEAGEYNVINTKLFPKN